MAQIARGEIVKPKLAAVFLALLACLVLCLIPSITMAQMTDAEICEQLQEAAAELNKEAGAKIDNSTTLDNVLVLCNLKIFEYRKSINVVSPNLKPGWEERRQRNWNRMMCKDPMLLAIRSGWSIKERLFSSDGEAYIISAKCDEAH
jgi:hypothetical protein